MADEQEWEEIEMYKEAVGAAFAGGVISGVIAALSVSGAWYAIKNGMVSVFMASVGGAVICLMFAGDACSKGKDYVEKSLREQGYKPVWKEVEVEKQ